MSRALALRSPHSMWEESIRQDLCTPNTKGTGVWGADGCSLAGTCRRLPHRLGSTSASCSQRRKRTQAPPRASAAACRRGRQEGAEDRGRETGLSTSPSASPPKRRLLQVPASFSTPEPTSSEHAHHVHRPRSGNPKLLPFDSLRSVWISASSLMEV